MAPGAEEVFELGGGLVDLLAGRAAALVGQLAAVHRVAVLVELGVPPVVTRAVHGRVAVLALDRDQPARPEQQVVDLAAPVAVAADQRPLVVQDPGQPGRDQLFPLDPGHQDAHLVRVVPSRRWLGGAPPFPAGREDATQPCGPAVLGAGQVPLPGGTLDAGMVLRESVLVSGPLTLGDRVRAQPCLPEQGARMIR